MQHELGAPWVMNRVAFSRCRPMPDLRLGKSVLLPFTSSLARIFSLNPKFNLPLPHNKKKFNPAHSTKIIITKSQDIAGNFSILFLRVLFALWQLRARKPTVHHHASALRKWFMNGAVDQWISTTLKPATLAIILHRNLNDNVPIYVK